MSITIDKRSSGPGPGACPGPSSQLQLRRVRHEVWDGFVVVAFSAVSSTALAGAMLLLVRLAG